MSTKKQRIVVAMSGGVDSSVAAALLTEQGYEVIGITMRLWSYEADANHGCCTPEDLLDARKVASRLGIPYYVSNMEETFDEHVVQQFVDSYARGETPNPCVRCNTDIKFKELLAKAKELGADYLATGHYAQIEKNGSVFNLKRAQDLSKDQSYFLFGLTQAELAQIMFPLGHLTKDKVREIAKKYGLDVATKKDSQEICFVPKDYKTFVESRLSPSQKKAGFIVDRAGEKLGEHDGIHRFTIGQRKGLGVPGTLPMYVMSIEENGDVVVGAKEEMRSSHVAVRELTWTHQSPSLGERVFLKIRSRFEPAEAVISDLSADFMRLTFMEPQASVTPGQAAVVYRNDECLGGGWIIKN